MKTKKLAIGQAMHAAIAASADGYFQKAVQAETDKLMADLAQNIKFSLETEDEREARELREAIAQVRKRMKPTRSQKKKMKVERMSYLKRRLVASDRYWAIISETETEREARELREAIRKVRNGDR